MRLIFLDRDGVINHCADSYITTVDEFEFISGSLEAIINLNRAGYIIVICTNQSGIARGLFGIDDLNAIHNKLHQQVNQAGGYIDAIVFCPHLPTDNCICRKPSPKMILDVCERFNIECTLDTIMVGDSLRDLQAIQAAGGTPILVKTGNGKKTLLEAAANNHYALPQHTLVCDDLLEASKLIIERT
jgi:D-glycero-D-manno-heptose 1,7-bisphosphate phosphatase